MEMTHDYKDLTLGMYIDLCKILEDHKDDEQSLDNDLTKQAELIAVLAGTTPREVLNMDFIDYRALAAQLVFLNTEPNMGTSVADCYNYGGFELVPCKDFRKLTAAQYIDFQNFLTLAQTDLATYYVGLLSTLLVPKGHKYGDGYDVVDVQNAVRNEMFIGDALTLTAFFLNLWAVLTKASADYCKSEMERMKAKGMNPAKIAEMEQTLKAAEDSLLAGAGSQTSTR